MYSIFYKSKTSAVFSHHFIAVIKPVIATARVPTCKNIGGGDLQYQFYVSFNAENRKHTDTYAMYAICYILMYRYLNFSV